MERLWMRDRFLAGRRVVIRTAEWFFWDVCCWMYRRAMVGRDNGSASSPFQRETSTSSRGRDVTRHGESATCQSEVCRYCRAMERTLFWEDFTFLSNLYLMIVLNVIFWICNMMGIPFRIFTVYFIIQLMIALKFMDTLAPAAEQRVCSDLHSLWRSSQKLRSEKPGLHCIVLCLVAFQLWFLGHVSVSSPYLFYWSFILTPLTTKRLKLLKFKLNREWQSDSEIEDEFLPVVTEANLQVLNRVGETGDHSPTPTSVQSDTQNDSFYDEDFIEGLQQIAFNMPYHGEGSTDGVELSELELSVGENDAEENGIKFQTGHFEKSSSSSSEEEVFDAKKMTAVSSDESNGDSDFEIIDKEEIAKIEM